MEEDREYNACKALDPQIDNEDDVHHSSPDYEINEQEIQKQMWLGGLHRCNKWAGRTRRSGFSGGLIWTGQTRQNTGLGGLGRTGRTGRQGRWDRLRNTRWGGLVRNTGLGGILDGADRVDWRTEQTSQTGRRRADGADVPVD